MFQIHRETSHVLNALSRSYPEVAFAIRVNVAQGRPAGLEEEETTGYGYMPFTADEQLELCRSYITDFIETPCRAALDLSNLARKYQETPAIGFLRGVDTGFFFNPPGEGAKAALDEFLTTVHAYIDTLKPKPPSPPDTLQPRGRRG
ncbi:hypothetical protein [Sinorhizobium saheli]|uniref:hypothetical protein n=1 Tax=Sinorhizobium saheli TaxID=36856 RepID=UPI001295923A|nr:hypothetical protein [Sinorhizobium saheli]MQW85977.1 hypothetical protein [Sinorhizobium saheli]